VARYFMGYWPSKLVTVLNIIIMVGYGVISCILGGQLLSAVSGGSMSIIVGIVIIALISWSVAVFGMTPFHIYERYVLELLPSSPEASFPQVPRIVWNSRLIANQMGLDTPMHRPLRPRGLCRPTL
jgi:hypothetical protein